MAGRHMAARQLGVLCKLCSFEITECRRGSGELRPLRANCVSLGEKNTPATSLSRQKRGTIRFLKQKRKKERTDYDTPLPCCYYWRRPYWPGCCGSPHWTRRNTFAL